MKLTYQAFVTVNFFAVEGEQIQGQPGTFQAALKLDPDGLVAFAQEVLSAKAQFCEAAGIVEPSWAGPLANPDEQ